MKNHSSLSPENITSEPTPPTFPTTGTNNVDRSTDLAPELEVKSTEQQSIEQLVAPDSSDEDVLRIARETVEELLQKMRVKSKVSARYGEADEARGRVPIYIDIQGNDLSILIGRQAETLNALQYISTLIVGKELGRSIRLVLDVEGYRQRREQQVRQLARRMAEQAIKTGRRQVLEPMPPNERRFVHIELRKNQEVNTESIGEGSRRKVTIIPR